MRRPGDDRDRARASSASRAWTAMRALGRRRRGAADRRRAVELVDRVRRRAGHEGVPAARAGREPGARAAALPHRARLPEHRAAGRLVRVRRAARSARDARDAAASSSRTARDGWELALDELDTNPEAFLDAGREPRRGHRRDAHGARRPTPATRPSRRTSRATRRCRSSPRPWTRRSSACSSTCPRTRPWRRSPARGQDVRERLSLLAQLGVGGRVIRTHGDYHLGQTMLTSARLGDPRLRGRAGAAAARAAPEALAAARRGGHAALVRLRRPPAAEIAARPGGAGGVGRSAPASAFLDGVPRPLEPALLPPGEEAIAQAAGGLRAREGGLRAALRAEQPTRLGGDPGGGDHATAGDRNERGHA